MNEVKNIILSITGSISAYKSFDLLRLLVKEGHQVKVILSKGALNFVKPELYRYLGALEVYSPEDDFNQEKYQNLNGSVLHIELSKWCDRFVIAPLSANSLAQLSQGLCDDLLKSVFLALDNKPVLLFPAMNTHMYLNPLTQLNIEKLNLISKLRVFAPSSGLLACGDEGIGKLPPIEIIADLITTANDTEVMKTVLITTGATVSPIDPVRYLTNPSSGITGYLIAKKYLSQGYRVIVLAGKSSTSALDNLVLHKNFQLIKVNTTTDMSEAVSNYFAKSDIYISAAAMCDFEFNQHDEKIKKSNTNNTLEFNYAPDILKNVLNKRTKQFIIGFAAETQTTPEMFLEKWERKPVDLLIGNSVHHQYSDKEAKGFGADGGHYYFIQKGRIINQAQLSKKELAEMIFNHTNQ
jgi:phosphopantothenoylcysteine decarboxylase/phosphopantothenate--cysteine ligase